MCGGTLRAVLLTAERAFEYYDSRTGSMDMSLTARLRIAAWCESGKGSRVVGEKPKGS